MCSCSCLRIQTLCMGVEVWHVNIWLMEVLFSVSAPAPAVMHLDVNLNNLQYPVISSIPSHTQCGQTVIVDGKDMLGSWEKPGHSRSRGHHPEDRKRNKLPWWIVVLNGCCTEQSFITHRLFALFMDLVISLRKKRDDDELLLYVFKGAIQEVSHMQELVISNPGAISLWKWVSVQMRTQQ